MENFILYMYLISAVGAMLGMMSHFNEIEVGLAARYAAENKKMSSWHSYVFSAIGVMITVITPGLNSFQAMISLLHCGATVVEAGEDIGI